jgi:hypothetical protein
LIDFEIEVKKCFETTISFNKQKQSEKEYFRDVAINYPDFNSIWNY